MKKTLTGLDFKIQEMAGRIRELREISGFSAQTMALKTGTSEEEYLRWLLALTLQISSRAAVQSFDPIR